MHDPADGVHPRRTTATRSTTSGTTRSSPRWRSSRANRCSCTCATPRTSRSTRAPDVEDVAKLDFSHVNPVSGPVFVKGARAGRRARGRAPRVRGQGLGLDGDHPRLRPPRRRVPGPVASDLRGRRGGGQGALRGEGHAAASALPGHARGRDARARRALDRAAVPLRREHGHQAPPHRGQPLPAGRRRGSAVLPRRHARRAGRRRGLRHGDRDRHGRDPPAHGSARLLDRGAAVPPAGRRGGGATRGRASTSAQASGPT